MMEQYGLELVVSEDDSVSYEWSVTDVWRDPTRRMFTSSMRVQDAPATTPTRMCTVCLI